MTPRSTLAFPSIALLALLAAIGLTLAPPESAADGSGVAKVARGKYLVDTSGCHDCHTPMKMGPKGPEPDMSRMLSGHPEALVMPPVPKLPDGPWLVTSAATNTAHAGPWGVSFAANLTPDAGRLGPWSAKDFIGAVK